MTEPTGITWHVVAELDSAGKPISYLRGLAAREFGPDVTYRLTPDLDQAWRLLDNKSAQEQAARFNSASGNPHLAVIELPTQN
ncbi:MAG: hypothetical protein WAO15_23975 [Mycobacterium sp.]